MIHGCRMSHMFVVKCRNDNDGMRKWANSQTDERARM